MSFKKTQWPCGKYSRETWMNERNFAGRTLPSYKSAPLFSNDLLEKRNCLYGQRSFSTSPDETNETNKERELQALSGEQFNTSDDVSGFTGSLANQERNPNKAILKERYFVTRSLNNAEDDFDASDDRENLQEQQVTFELGDKDGTYSDHMYENICCYNDINESSTSCSTEKNSSYSSDGYKQILSGSFDNCEYMSAEAASVRDDRSSEHACAYAIPRCNCVLKQKSVLTNNDNKAGDTNAAEVSEETKHLCTKLDVDNRLSSGYVCMDSYIHMNTIPQCRKKKKCHIYENDEEWVMQGKSLDNNGNGQECIYSGITENKLLDIVPEILTDESIVVERIPEDVKDDKEKCRNEMKYHDYENEKEWVKQDKRLDDNINGQESYSGTTENKSLDNVPERLTDESRGVGMVSKLIPEELKDDKVTEHPINRLSSQSFRRQIRRRDRKCLDHNLLEATLAQQEGGRWSPDYDLPIFSEMLGAERKTETLADEHTNVKLDTTELSKRIVYLPNIHPKLITFFKSSTTHRHHLEEEMNRKDTVIVWPSTEDGILMLQSASKSEPSLRSSDATTQEGIAGTFQKYLRNYSVDDSICASEEIFDDLSTLLQRTPIKTKCTIHNERMNFAIVGDKKSVEESKRQLLALINFLELRLKASKTYSTTKTKYMTRHEIRMVFESKLIDKCRTKNELLQVDVCDNFEYVRFKGEMQAVDLAMKELQEYLIKVKGRVYKCSKLVRQLLTRSQAKQHLQQLLRNHSLVCAWKITDSTCIVYGTSNEDIQFVKDIFKKVLVAETILLSQGQKGLLQSKLGMAEIKTIMQTYDGILEFDISDTSVEIACIQRIQEEVSKRLKKFLHKHEVVNTVQELENGMFQFLQRFSRDRICDLKKRCTDIFVELTVFEEKLKCGFVLTGKRDFCKIAVRELEKMLSNVTSFDHTLKRVGLVQFLQSDNGRGQISALESDHKCILHFSDGSPISQNKICVCQYRGKDIVVLQEDIGVVSTGLAYIPCSPSCEEMRHKVEGEMPRALVARECMVSPDTKHTNKSNFFACLPDIQPRSSEARDALKASVELSLREVKKRDMTTVAFSTCTSTTKFPSTEYAKVLVETIKTFLDGEKQTTKLKTVMFCAKDASQTSSFVQTLKQTFGCKNVQVNGSIRETATMLSASNLIDGKDSTIYSTAREVDDAKREIDNRYPIDVNLVKENIASIKADAILIMTHESRDLRRGSLQLDANIAETIREKIQTNFPCGIAIGQVVSLTVEDLLCDVVYIANLGPASTDKEAARKILDTVVRTVLDKCVEDETESLAFTSLDVGIYLLAEIIFSAMKPFISKNSILERIDIVVDPQDRSSYLPFEAMRKQFYERTNNSDSSDCLHQHVTNPIADEKKGSLSYTEGCVRVDIVMGDITKETTDAIVNSVQGNLDLSTGMLAKAVSEAAGSEIQTELRTKQNVCKIRRDGFVIGGPGKLPCRYIFHVKIRGSIDGWKNIVSVCMQQAESLGITSVSFPALGTGRKGIKPRYFTKIILKCIRRFASSNPKSLNHIRIVVLEDTMFQTILQAANAFKCKKRRHTLKDKIYDMLRKESPKQPEEEVMLQVYTEMDNVENVKTQLDKLCLKVSLD